MRSSILTALATLVTSVLAAPTLSFPFNSQLPPVAQWGTAYSYTFSPDTYRSDDGDITYSSPDLPSWLSINGRTLSGTPTGGSGDSTFSFELIASDSTGESSSNCTLQITDSQLPTYSPSDLEAVLKESGPVANANSAVLVPNQQFEINFPSTFFTSEGTVIGHYAVTSDHSPLPIWLNFDGGAGKFSGTAPAVNSEIAQAQDFSVIYIVSTFNGFESAGAEFNLLLGANVLSMNVSTDSVNATAEREFTYSVPLNEITLNNHPITTANLSSAKANIPSDAQSWLNWDTDAYQLSGTPPDSAAGNQYVVGIDIVDTYNDAVSWDVAISVTSANNITVFSESSLPPANATRGKWFQYDLGSYVLNKDIELSIQQSSNTNWLSVNNDNLTLSGMVPSSFDKASLNITAVPKSSSSSSSKKRDTALQEKYSSSLTARLELYGVGPMISSSMSSSSSMSRTTSHSHSSSSSYRSITSTSASSSGASSSRGSSSTGASRSSNTASGASSTSTSTSSPSPFIVPSKKSSNNAVAIGCGVGIPVGLIAIAAVVLLLFCCRRRRRNANNPTDPAGAGGMGYEKDSGVGAEDANISAPRPNSQGMFVAPVFRAVSNSSGGDEFEDAVEYPGELAGGDEKTIYDTADKDKFAKSALDTPDSLQNLKPGHPWDSPQRASTLNFIAMDDESSSSKHGQQRSSDDETIASIEPHSPNGPLGTLATEVPPHSEEDDVLGEIPRESWRHTNTGERRWQDARLSQSSLASIVPTEPPTVLLAQGEFAENMAQSQRLQQQLQEQEAAQAAGAAYVPAQPGMQREYSSGVLHRVGSHSSSMYSASHRNSQPLSDRIGEHYRSGSSADSTNSHDLSDDSGTANFRPYRDENGELHWREETTSYVPGEQPTTLNDVGLDRKPSAAKTPRGDQGEFVFV